MILSEICTFKNGKSIKIDKNNNYKIPIYGSTGILGFNKESLVNQPVCLIARVGANCGFVQLVKEPCWVTDNTIICYPKNGISIRYLYYLLSTLNINSKRIGSSQPLITSSILNNISIIEHTKTEQNHIVDTICYF